MEFIKYILENSMFKDLFGSQVKVSTMYMFIFYILVSEHIFITKCCSINKIYVTGV